MKASSASVKPYTKPALDIFVNHEADCSFKKKKKEKNSSIIVKLTWV